MSCGTGRGRGSDPMGVWRRGGGGAAALIQPLAWKLPYAEDAAQKKKKKKKAYETWMIFGDLKGRWELRLTLCRGPDVSPPTTSGGN